MNIQIYVSQILDELRKTLAHVSNGQGEKLANAIIGARTVFVAGAGSNPRKYGFHFMQHSPHESGISNFFSLARGDI